VNSAYPVYTTKSECLDCYKCVRECYVKAIRIEDGHASIIPEQCIACGNCIKACPQNAKKVRSDLEKAKSLVLSGKKVFISLAPSWRGVWEFPEHNFIKMLKKLGFNEVSETALGAQEVSIETAKFLSKQEKGLFLSSACPAAVDFIRLYMPEYAKCITNIASPALTHAKMLKEQYGNDIAVVFVGPCIAKKNESDKHPELIDIALTFEELNLWIEQEELILNRDNTQENYKFVPEKSYEGALYPLEGGMNETIKRCNPGKDVQLINISSLDSIKKSLEGIDLEKVDKPVFIEALDGGCVAGPCISTEKAGISIISDVLSNVQTRKYIPNKPKLVVKEQYLPSPEKEAAYSLLEIENALKSIGKYSIEDELNCGGCGYNNCHQFAEALLAGKAETSMCVSYMRKTAMKKAGAMLRCMPSGVVIVNNHLKIVEINNAFIKMFVSELYERFQDNPEDLIGAKLEKLLPCADIFKQVLKTGKDIHKELYDITVFNIETSRIIGAIIVDVTKSEMKRDQIAKKAQTVINKNISVVQEIACLLGEHMVDTEVLLNSIAEGYESKNPKES